MPDHFEGDLGRLAGQLSSAGTSEDRDPKDEALAELQGRATEQEDKRHEERFLFVLVIIVMFDAMIFTHMASWSGAVVIGVIELFGLIVFARRCGIEEVQWLVSRFLQVLNRS